MLDVDSGLVKEIPPAGILPGRLEDDADSDVVFDSDNSDVADVSEDSDVADVSEDSAVADVSADDTSEEEIPLEVIELSSRLASSASPSFS